MTMPYLNDIYDYEWSWVDYFVIIFNLCGFIFGWDTMIYLLTISVMVLGLLIFCLFVLWACLKCSRQIVIN